MDFTFSQINYPQNQKFLTHKLACSFNQFFFDLTETKRKVLTSKAMLDNFKVTTSNLKQVYEIKDTDLCLRFDHTHILKQDLLVENQELKYNEHTCGPVFRKEPSAKGRYREFYQYDCDYLYEDHQVRPILILSKIFKGNYLIIINDHSIKYKTKKEFKKTFFKKYPLLKKIKNLVLDPSYSRPTWYKDLVFEIVPKGFSSAICGGGVYKANNTNVLGFSIGLSRLLYYLRQQKTDCFTSKKILIYYVDKIPYMLLDYLQNKGYAYILKKKSFSLQKHYKKDEKVYSNLLIKFSAILIVSEAQDKNNRYHYKVKKSGYNLFTRAKLLKYLPKQELTKKETFLEFINQ